MCTAVRFTDDAGNMYFGRNLDWSFSFGESVFATQKGFTHEKLLDGKLEAKYASMGVGICVDGFPLYFDAGNEKGLSCAGLNFAGYAVYSKGDQSGKTNVPQYAFPLFVVSQYASVDEAKKALVDVAITDTAFSDKMQPAGLHWIISDSDQSIVVEYQEDGMHIYDNDLDVLANQPTYPYHHENVRSYISATPDFPKDVTWREDTLAPYGSGSGMRGIPGDFYSPSRFVRAAYLNAHYPVQKGEAKNVTRLFKTLQGVAMIVGGAKMGDGEYEFTTYTSCFSPTTMSYYYDNYDDPTIRKFELSSADFGSGNVVQIPESK